MKIEIETDVLELSFPNAYIAREKWLLRNIQISRKKRGRGRAGFPGNYKIDE